MILWEVFLTGTEKLFLSQFHLNTGMSDSQHHLDIPSPVTSKHRLYTRISVMLIHTGICMHG